MGRQPYLGGFQETPFLTNASHERTPDIKRHEFTSMHWNKRRTRLNRCDVVFMRLNQSKASWEIVSTTESKQINSEHYNYCCYYNYYKDYYYSS